jgi:hypothetical protein
LFVVALVGFNFESMTSGAIFERRETSVSVTPNVLTAGHYININVKPKKCVNSIVGIYGESDLRKATVKSKEGGDRRVCQAFTARYKTSPSWKPGEDESGLFFVKVFDYEKEDYIVRTFTIAG